MLEKSNGRLIAGLAILLLLPLSVTGSALAVDDTAEMTGAGVMVPLYTYPGSTWDRVIEVKNSHPDVPIAAIVNPSSGPGGSRDSNYSSRIDDLKSEGVIVLGYVSTAYTSRNIDNVKGDIDKWSSWYPDIDGIFFDEQTNWSGGESYYREASDYAESKGLTFSVGNPGANSIPSYLDTVDVVIIYESPGLPSLGNYDNWDRHANSKLGMIPFSVGSMPTSWVQDAMESIGWIYVTNDNLPNPWDSLPPYFDELVEELDDGSSSSPSEPAEPEYSLTVKSVDQNGDAINGMWVEVKEDGRTVRSGFTPMTVSLESSRYAISAGDYQQILFDHWSDNTGTSTMTVNLSSDVSVTAHYEDGALAPKAPLSIRASADKTSGTEGTRITFSPSIAGGAAPYQWMMSFSNGQQSSYASSETSISYTYQSAGTYSAVATAKDAAGNIVNSVPVTISITEAAIEYSLTIKSVDQNGDAINGMWAEIQQEGRVVKSGFTPLEHNVVSGMQYTVASGDYNNILFDHWNNGSTNRAITITPSQSMALTAHYDSGQPQQPKEVAVTVRSADLSGKAISGLWTVVAKDGQTVKTGYSPLTYTATAGSSYDVSVANYAEYSFDHWDNDSQSSTRKVTASVDSTITAHYRTGEHEPKEYRLSIRSVDLSGNAINGMWAEVRQDGDVIKSGFTSLSFIMAAGTEYVVAVGDYQNVVFDHWEDGSKNRFRTIDADGDASITAYYRK